MSELTFFGVGGVILLVLAAVMTLFSLLFGALCLHLSAKLLGVRGASYGHAFKTHVFLALLSIVLAIAAQLGTGLGPSSAMLPGVLAIGLLVAAFILPTLVVQSAYQTSFFGALVICILTGVVETAIGLAAAFGLVMAVIAAGIVAPVV
jgi:hypothetical protein